MLLSNPAKFLFLALVIFTFTACGSDQGTAVGGESMIPETTAEFPFPSKEPEDFQAELVITAGGSTQTTRIARKGDLRRTDYRFGTPEQYSVMHSDRGYLISEPERIYAFETPDNAETAPPDVSLFEARSYTEFEEIGKDGAIKTFRAKPENSGSTEILIYVDENIGMPVKQEFYSIRGNDRVLQYTSEIRNFQTGSDESLFAVPENFRRVSREEFLRRIKR